MGEPSNADSVRRLLLASNVGDIDAFLDRLHPDIEWHSVGLFLHPAQVWRGHAALRRGMQQRVERYRGHPQVILREVTESDDHVLVVGAIAIPTSHRPGILPVAWLFGMSDRKVVHARTFTVEQTARVEWASLVAQR